MAAVHIQYYFPDTSFLTPTDKARHDTAFRSSNYTFGQYKNEVESALRLAFGDSMVERKNKCLRVAGNTNRTPIDIVPAFEHHRYSSYDVVSYKGIEFFSDAGPRIYSFPEQHYQSGVTKNADTSRSFKAMVRILKRVRQRLVDDDVAVLADVDLIVLAAPPGWTEPSRENPISSIFSLM